MNSHGFKNALQPLRRYLNVSVVTATYTAKAVTLSHCAKSKKIHGSVATTITPRNYVIATVTALATATYLTCISNFQALFN